MLPKYCFYDDVLTEQECSLIIETGQQNMQRANTANDNPGDYRTGSVGWFVKGKHPDIDPMLERVVEWFGRTISEGFHGARIRGVEPIQFTHYEKGDHFDWHYDSFDTPNKPIRLFSASMELSDPSTYTGGGLEFHTLEEPIPERKLGRLIVFPSLLLHRARKVETGTRTSLVLWGHA